MKTLILLSLLLILISCTEQSTEYQLHRLHGEYTVQGLYLSIHYEQDSTWAYFYDKSVFVGVGVYARTHDVSREYKPNEFEVTGNDTIKLTINERRYEMKYRLLKDIGLLESGGVYHSKEDGTIVLAFGGRGIDALIEQGYIEIVQEPWATDKDMIEFARYFYMGTSNNTEMCLQQFKKERGR